MKLKPNKIYSTRLVIIAGIITFIALIITNGNHFFDGKFSLGAASQLSQIGLAQAATKADPSASAEAFLKASQVLLSPRCFNCHPAGDRPLQGDAQRIHNMQVVRGPEGMGKNGLWCSTCHQEKNIPDAELPGAPGWQLPSADMPMVFEKRTPRQLCEQLKDPAQNGHRGPEDIIEHVRDAPIVIWGWHPGPGRTPAPLSHDEFVKLITEWVEKGQACPK
jgi:hypothetical protein